MLDKRMNLLSVPQVPCRGSIWPSRGGMDDWYHCIAAALALLAVLAAPAAAAQRPHAIAHLKDLDGKPVGTVDFRRGQSRRADRVRSARPAARARMASICTPPAIATPRPASPRRADPDPGPWQRKHGYLAEGGPEAGDLPNQFAGADGRLHASVVASGFGLGNGKRSIFDRDGVAIIVDQRGDDYRTQPLGNAGDAHRLRRGDPHRRAQGQVHQRLTKRAP